MSRVAASVIKRFYYCKLPIDYNHKIPRSVEPFVLDFSVAAIRMLVKKEWQSVKDQGTDSFRVDTVHWVRVLVILAYQMAETF